MIFSCLTIVSRYTYAFPSSSFKSVSLCACANLSFWRFSSYSEECLALIISLYASLIYLSNSSFFSRSSRYAVATFTTISLSVSGFICHISLVGLDFASISCSELNRFRRRSFSPFNTYTGINKWFATNEINRTKSKTIPYFFSGGQWFLHPSTSENPIFLLIPYPYDVSFLASTQALSKEPSIVQFRAITDQLLRAATQIRHFLENFFLHCSRLLLCSAH